MTQAAAASLLDRIINWALDNPVPRALRYVIAAALIILVAVLRAALITSALPWLLFVPVILGISLVFGQAVGIFASLCATLAAALTIGSVDTPWFLTGPQWSASSLFLLVTAVMARIAGELRESFERSRTLNAELAEREAFLASVLASSTDCIKVIDLDGRLTFMSEGGMKVMEVSEFNEVRGCPWPDFWQGDGNIDAIAAIDAAREGRSTHFSGKADTFRGTTKWWDVSVSPIPGPNGRPDRILAVSRDMTALFEAQEEQQLLNAELGHRLKNVLALVQSIANQTFRQADNVEAANATFAARLAALGKATDVLTSATWQSADLRDVVKAGLISFGGDDRQVELAGPPVKLDAQIALALTLALHELTTNACKYGALSCESGKVSLEWELGPGENEAETRFRLRWRETGGPSVQPPERRGFGSRMIERSLRGYFRGETLLEFLPQGVTFAIDAPLPRSSTEA